MSGFCGMDTAQVRVHARRLHGAADRLEAWRLRLDAAVAGTAWSGPDAEAFRALWAVLSQGDLAVVAGDLAGRGEQASSQADEQDAASSVEGGAGGVGAGGADPGGAGVCASGATGPASGIPDAPASTMRRGYLEEDNPFLADWVEHPAEQLLSGTAHTVSDSIGHGWDLGLDVLAWELDGNGRRSDSIGQLRRDGDRFGGILEDWASGERVPTYAELGASGLVMLGSGGAVGYEGVSNVDTGFLDDRPGGIVSDVRVKDAPTASPRDLGDLIIGNDALRMRGRGADSSEALETGQIGVQEVRSDAGGDPVYIVQVPPTEGARFQDIGGAYGQQGNSRDWGSNLRLVAGQDPAAMDDVRAAMQAADVPAGADVLLVGHSQGGIVTSHLAADPSFNSTCGQEGTYNVTHSFSVGSPVQTVIPSQDSTEVVNVAHGPVGLDPHLTPGPDLEYTGDPIAELDLQGAQAGGGSLSAPNVHEVVLPGSTQHASDGEAGVAANHDSFSGASPGALYYGSVQEHTASDPVLSALQGDLDGRYIGAGTHVSRSTVVDVGRGEP